MRVMFRTIVGGVLVLAVGLAACGSDPTGPASFTVGGSVAGLSGTLVLQNNGRDDRTISTNSAFTFASPVADGGFYSVTILTQPAGQNCAVTNASGTVSRANVTNVGVTCTTTGLGLTVVINEVDYDQVGTDGGEFIEIYNPTGAAIDLSNVVVAFINGASATEYFRVALSGRSLPAGAYLVIANSSVAVAAGAEVIRFTNAADNVQNGPPDGIVLFDVATNSVLDALSYEGSITAAAIVGAPGIYNLVEGTATGASDSNVANGSLVRSPNGTDTNNAAADWLFTATPTPGAANGSP